MGVLEARDCLGNVSGCAVCAFGIQSVGLVLAGFRILGLVGQFLTRCLLMLLASHP